MKYIPSVGPVLNVEWFFKLSEGLFKLLLSLILFQNTNKLRKTRDTYRLKVKGWKKIFHANRDQKKAGIAILISDKIDFKTKAVKRDKATT